MQLKRGFHLNRPPNTIPCLAYHRLDDIIVVIILRPALEPMNRPSQNLLGKIRVPMIDLHDEILRIPICA
jgi:hypothetical protein